MLIETGNPDTRRGQALLSGLLLLVILLPIGYYAVDRVVAPAPAGASEVFLERPAPENERCVRDTRYMRHHHWELLREVRKEVVRYGKRGDISLNNCRDCHTNREKFCNVCHDAVSMTPDCFGCHYYP